MHAIHEKTQMGFAPRQIGPFFVSICRCFWRNSREERFSFWQASVDVCQVRKIFLFTSRKFGQKWKNRSVYPSQCEISVIPDTRVFIIKS